MNNCSFDKKDVPALPIWIGGRALDHSDLETFYFKFDSWRSFPSYEIFAYPHALLEINDLEKIYEMIKSAGEGVFNRIKSGLPLVIFIIMNWKITELLKNCGNIVPEIASNDIKLRPPIFIYKIIADIGQDPVFIKDGFTHEEEEAHGLGAVYSFWNDDAPSAGSERLIGLMNRIMGADLRSKNFPDYTQETIRKISWHINGESFNSFGKEGTIPKYKFDKDGKPIFLI